MSRIVFLVLQVLFIIFAVFILQSEASATAYYHKSEPENIYPTHFEICSARNGVQWPQMGLSIDEAICSEPGLVANWPHYEGFKVYTASSFSSCYVLKTDCTTGTITTLGSSTGVLGSIENACDYLLENGLCSATQPEDQTCVDNGSATEPFYTCTEQPTVLCTGYQDCYQWSYAQEGCQLTQDTADLEAALCYEESFDYTDDNIFSMSCHNVQCITGDVDIDEWQNVEDFVLADNGHNTNNDVIDHADPTLGGGDGGTFGTGTGVGSGDTTDDPSNAPRTLIDDSMIINAVDNQTSMLNEMLNQNTEEIKDSASGVTDAIGDLGSSGVSVGNALGSEIEKTNSLLDSIENEMLSEGRHVYDDNGYIIGVDRGANFESIFAQSPVSQALSNITGLINLGDLSCSPFSINLTSTIVGRSISTNVICEGFDALAPVISTVMIVLYMFAGFRIFAAA